MRAFSTPRCGPGPMPRFSASRPGPATAIPTDLPGTCSRSPGCGRSSPASGRGMKRVSYSGRNEVLEAPKPVQGRSMTDASAFVLDGAAIAGETLAHVAEEARALIAQGLTPGLAVVLVGDNPASQTY